MLDSHDKCGSKIHTSARWQQPDISSRADEHLKHRTPDAGAEDNKDNATPRPIVQDRVAGLMPSARGR